MRLRTTITAVIILCSTLVGLAQNRLLFTDPSKRYSIEFPKDWKWTTVNGAGPGLVFFTQPKSEAAVVVEFTKLRQRLEARDITDVFAQIEADYVKEYQPLAADITAKVTNQDGRPMITVDYVRGGLGGRERVRQYSFPSGTDLVRVTCMALQNQFAKHETAMAAMASSVKNAADVAAGK